MCVGGVSRPRMFPMEPPTICDHVISLRFSMWMRPRGGSGMTCGILGSFIVVCRLLLKGHKQLKNVVDMNVEIWKQAK